jgi:indolepyruvate ferredoxin oxidoreductase
LVERVRQAEHESAGSASGVLTRSVSLAYFRLLAYKDEYEVARLHTRPEFLQTLRERYGNTARLKFHLAPPILNRGNDARGRPRKKEFGAWVLPLFRVLARMKRLRGTALDLFGHTAERKMERQLIGEFEHTLEQLLTGLRVDNVSEAAEIVALYMEIRGYGPVKEAALERMRPQIESRLAAFASANKQAA